ncbi:Abi family protein [Holdemanella biformis]|uniref:Abi family protein n=2 Tax=Holdemanella biformis TaxID=1735 RepID=UPI00307F8B44
MSKPFKTLDEQISILKSRGLIIPDEEAAKLSLLCNNYYNVINYYSKFFMVGGTDNYLPDVSFNEILSVYYFDKEIKSSFLNDTLDLEKCLKSLIAYYFSEAHSEDYSYLNVNNFDCSKITKTVNLISGISKTIAQKEREKIDNSVKHYLNHHFNVPLWVIMNYLSFGQVVQFYELMKQSDQNKIAKRFSDFSNKALNTTTVHLDSKKLLSYLKNIHEIRNITAHSNKFIGFKCKENAHYLNELHSLYNIGNNDSKQDVFNVFVTMRIFLAPGNFTTFNNSIRKRMVHLSKNVNSIDVNEIFEKLGFPYDWYKLPAKQL